MLMLEGTLPAWLLGLLCFALGVVLGTMATWLLVARKDRTRELQAELDELRQNSRTYRDEVTRHFMRTSDLVQAMTRSYREVYEHLASGAQTLCREDSAAEQLDQRETVRLAGSDEEPGAEFPGEEEDFEALLGETPRISDLDITAETDSPAQVKH